MAWYYDDLDEIKKQAEMTAAISHDHPEGIKGAVAVAHGIYILRTTHDLRKFRIAMQKYYPYGGDSDTIGAIVGSLAEAMWRVPKGISDKVFDMLPTDMLNVIGDFFHLLNQKKQSI